MSALHHTHGQLLKVSDQISVSLRSSQEQLEEARANAADLHTELRSTQELLQHANETLLIKVRMKDGKLIVLSRASNQPGGGTTASPMLLDFFFPPFLFSPC